VGVLEQLVADQEHRGLHRVVLRGPVQEGFDVFG
jgi:hypothetical protein